MLLRSIWRGRLVGHIKPEDGIAPMWRLTARSMSSFEAGPLRGRDQHLEPVAAGAASVVRLRHDLRRHPPHQVHRSAGGRPARRAGDERAGGDAGHGGSEQPGAAVLPALRLPDRVVGVRERSSGLYRHAAEAVLPLRGAGGEEADGRRPDAVRGQWREAGPSQPGRGSRRPVSRSVRRDRRVWSASRPTAPSWSGSSRSRSSSCCSTISACRDSPRGQAEGQSESLSFTKNIAAHGISDLRCDRRAGQDNHRGRPPAHPDADHHAT